MRLKEVFAVFISVCVFHVFSASVQSQTHKCGIQSKAAQPVGSAFSFGGVKLKQKEFKFPWLVALHDSSTNSFFCAGSLISKKHVLSGKS